MAPPRLLDRLRAAVRARHYSRRTEEAYVAWVRRYVVFHGKRHPDELGEAEINAFLTDLAVTRQVSTSTQNQALSALLFLYRDVLGRTVDSLGDVVRARRPARLPVVLTRDEVRRVLANLSGREKLVATLLYGAGLRLLDALRLRVKDVDFALNQIVVRDGKGQKDRHTMLPLALKPALTAHLRTVRARFDADLAANRAEAVRHLEAVDRWADLAVARAAEASAAMAPGAAENDGRGPRCVRFSDGNEMYLP